MCYVFAVGGLRQVGNAYSIHYSIIAHRSVLRRHNWSYHYGVRLKSVTAMASTWFVAAIAWRVGNTLARRKPGKQYASLLRRDKTVEVCGKPVTGR